MPMAPSEHLKDLCLRLLHAETEDDVIRILKGEGFWEDRGAWRPYGDIPNNRSIVGNQQSSPVAALVEKLVNSIDAVLMAECRRRGIDPASPQAPPDMRSAMEQFFGVKEGRMSGLSAGERTKLASHIHLVAVGTKECPAYMIIDDGEGQSPDQFEDTFLSLVRENKTRIPFVQGKFNMGGTGVLQFAGANSFQLIVSRRQPDIVEGHRQVARQWGFTLVRRLDPDEHQPQSTYVYLAPRREILSFDADSLPLLPGRYPSAYEESLGAGTCIKLWNYKVPGRLKSIATLDLRYALERHLQDPVLPVRICERRHGYRAHYYDTTVSGLSVVLSDKHDDIELNTGSSLKIVGVGDVAMQVFVIKEEALEQREERYPPGVFFLVNGQLHSELGKEFVARRTKLDYVADSVIVAVDCTSLPSRVREDLFMASRDRMRQCGERDALEEAIAEYLKEHPGLRELNARRRQERLEASSGEEVAEMLASLVKADPALADLFGRGGKQVKVPKGVLPEPVPYQGRRFPTYFRIRNEPKTGLVKQCPRNWSCRVEFETDASNDYFTRVSDPGRIDTSGAPQLALHYLWNGRAVLKFGLPATANVGDRYRVEVRVSDVSRIDALSSVFDIAVEEEAPPPRVPPPHPSRSDFAALPEPHEVRQDQWAHHGFNEYSALAIKSGEDDQMDVYVNMDNIHLRNEIARRKEFAPEVLKRWFKVGLLLLALGMLHQERAKAIDRADAANGGGEAQQDDLYERVARATEGLAVTLIPVIVHLGRV